MNVLYIISKSPYETREPFIGISLAESGDVVVFVASAVIVKERAPWEFHRIMEEKRGDGVEFLFLKEDLQLNNIDSKGDDVIDRAKFLEMIQGYLNVMQY